MNEVYNTAELQNLEKEILQRKNNIALNMLEIGDRLTRAKELLDHGQFTEWLDKNVSISPRMARNYMRASKVYPESKRQSISVLTSTQVLLLSELPEETRDSFTKKVDIEKMSTRELKEAIKAEKANEDILSHFAESTEDSYKEYDIEIDKLKPFEYYDYYVKDTLGVRQGKDYIDFLSWMDKGAYLPIMITKDNVILDGHERVRAAKDLGWKTIKARYCACWTGSGTGHPLETLDQTIKSVFFELQRWEYTRTSVFMYFSALFYESIGRKDKAEEEWFMLKMQGEEIDKADCEAIKTAYKYLEENEKMKGEN